MRKSIAFRPSDVDALEDRLVLSRVSVAPSAAVAHHATATPQEKATAKVREAFSTFDQNLTQAVNNDLALPLMTGSGTAMGNAPLYNEQIGQDLTTLERSVLKAPGHLAAGAPAVSQVRQLILGSGEYSLRTRLNALTMSTLVMGSSLTSYLSVAVEETQQTFTKVNQEILASLSSTAPAQTASTSSS
jgi:hypothetical protein